MIFNLLDFMDKSAIFTLARALARGNREYLTFKKEVKSMRIPFLNSISWYLVAAMFIIGITPSVNAGLSPSEIISASFDRANDLERVQKVIETKKIKERLEKLGFTTEEVRSRLSSLTDRQIHQLALNLDELKVGGDDGLGIIIALLIIAILIVVLLHLTGHKVIIK